MTIIQFNLDKKYENKEFIELKDSLNNDIQSIVYFLNNMTHADFDLSFEHNFDSNSKITTIYLNNLYCRIFFRSNKESSIYFWLSKDHIDSSKLKHNDFLIFSDIIKQLSRLVNLKEFHEKFSKLLLLTKELNKSFEDNLYKDYNKKIKKIVEYFNNNQDKYIKSEDNSTDHFWYFEFYKNKPNNTIDINSGGYKSFLSFKIYIPYIDSLKIKSLLQMRNNDEAIHTYIEIIKNNNPFIYSFIGNYFNITISKNQKTIIHYIPIPIDFLFDRIKFNSELTNF